MDTVEMRETRCRELLQYLSISRFNCHLCRNERNPIVVDKNMNRSIHSCASLNCSLINIALRPRLPVNTKQHVMAFGGRRCILLRFKLGEFENVYWDACRFLIFVPMITLYKVVWFLQKKENTLLLIC